MCLSNRKFFNVITIKLFLTLLSVLLFSSGSFANFDQAMRIYEAERFDEAKEAFEALAAIGGRPALFNLGVMYYRGEIGESDPVKAYVLMKIANDDYNNELFGKVVNSLLGRFNAAKIQQAEKLYAELEPVYGIKKINDAIFPSPLDDADCPPEVQAISKVPPMYPRSENRAGRMGLTYTEYTISPEGYSRDVLVVSSTSKAFSRAAIRSNKRFLYEPTIDGKPVYGHRNRMIFTLDLNGGQAKTKILTKELKAIEASATSGDIVAQYQYGARLNTFRYFKEHLKKLDLQYRTANEWFTKSAKGGFTHAQFELGRNMIDGRGCKVDKVNGYKWIKAAALGGHASAQKMLAQSALVSSNTPDQKSMAVVSWLRRAAQSGDYPSKLLLAWELSTSAEKALRDGNEALALLEGEYEFYADDVRIYETKAAAYAENGDFKKAIRYQKKAIDEAEDMDWEIPLLSVRLYSYEHNEPFRGTYF